MLVLLFACLLSVGFADRKDVQDKEHLAYQKSTWKLYLEENGRRMVLTTVKNGVLRDCYISGDNKMIKIMVQMIPKAKVLRLDSYSMSNLANYCTYAKWTRAITGSSGEEVWQEFGIMSGMFIYPGTKWCGAGNISESYDDLGPEKEADYCCRDHDHCNDTIEGFGSKYGLPNNAPYTKSHCRCDEQFYDCLRTADTRASNRIGNIYFNYIRVECFQHEYPILACKRYKGWFRPRCEEYEFDEEQEPIWQMFDAKHYKPITEDQKRIGSKDVFDYIILSSLDTFNQTNGAKNKNLNSI